MSDHTNQKLYVEIDVYFPAPLRFGVVVAKNVNLFVHANITPENSGFKFWNIIL